MAANFNCPRCGGTNEYGGEGDLVRCQFCGSEVRPPQEFIAQAAQQRFTSKMKVWVVLFVIVVFVIPTCAGLGGTLVGVGASIIGTLVSIFAPLIGK